MLHPSAFLGRLAMAAAFGAIIVGSATAQDTSVRVTHQAAFTSAKNLLAKLSAETGVRLEPAAIMADEPIFLSVTDVPLAELMNRIAAATNGEWERAGEGYRLNRGTALTQRLRAQELAVRSAALKTAVENYLTSSRGAPVLDEATAKKLVEEQVKRRAELAQQLQGQHAPQRGDRPPQITASFSDMRHPAGPARRGLDLLMETVRTDELAKIEPGERVVFSSNPTRMQRPAIFDASRVASEYVRLHNMIANVAQQVRSNEDISANIRIQMPGAINPDAKPITGIGKLLLVATRRTNDPTLSLELRVLDREGATIDSYMTSLSLANTAQPAAKVASEPQFEFSPLSRELLTLMVGAVSVPGVMGGDVVVRAQSGPGGATMVFSSVGSPVTTPKISSELLNRLTKPEEFDPLSFFVTDAFLSLAKSSKKNVVASVPDSMFSATATGMARTNVDPATFADEQGAFGTVARSDDEWLVVSAAEPWTALQSRVPREPLGRAIRSALQKKYLTLDDLGAFASRLSAYREANGIDQRYMDLVVPHTGMKYRTVMAQSLSALKLFHSLNVSQRNELQRSGRIAAASLSPNQVTLLNQIVFGPDSGGIISFAGQGATASMTMVADVRTATGGQPPNIPIAMNSSERTEAMPNGIPREAALQVTGNSSEGVLMMRANDRDGSFQSTFGLFMSRQLSEEAKAAMEASEYRLAAITDYSISLVVGETTLESRSLTDGQVVPTSGVFRYGSLPESIKNAMAEHEQRMGQRINFAPPPVRSGGGGG